VLSPQAKMERSDVGISANDLCKSSTLDVQLYLLVKCLVALCKGKLLVVDVLVTVG